MRAVSSSVVTASRRSSIGARLDRDRDGLVIVFFHVMRVIQNQFEVGDLQVFWLDRNLAPRDEFDGDTTRARVELLDHMTRRAIKRSFPQADQLDPRAVLIRQR